jgi:hypothetical protein
MAAAANGSLRSHCSRASGMSRNIWHYLRGCFRFPGLTECAFPRDEAWDCSSALDECCDSMGCEPDACVVFHPADGTEPRNVCVPLGCTPEPCGAERICMGAGTYRDAAVCVKAMCQSDLDCNREPGGKCRMTSDYCGSEQAFYCLYPGRGCLSSAACISDEYFCGVAPNGTDMECQQKPANCPQ